MTTPATARILALLGLTVASSSTAYAGNILYCNDYVLGTDHLGNALASLSALHTTTSTTSIASCESQISSGTWDLVVLAIQNNSHSTPNFNSYVAAGGSAILQDWTRDSTRGSASGVTYGSTNSASMTVSLAAFSSGLSSSSVTFTNPGWGVYTTGMSSASVSAAQFATGEVAIAINSTDTVIVNGFLTDTITNAADAEQLYVNEIEYVAGYCDEDGDGYDAMGVCGGSDCDDGDAAVNPGADEYCNGVDDDCDGATDEDTAVDAVIWYADADSDTYGDAAVTDTECSQPSGYVADNTDCDDTVATTYPGANEYCNGVDDDCDGTVDEDDAVDVLTWFRDADTDGYGDASATDDDCDQPTGYVAVDTDCDDADPDIYPGAPEVPYDGIDQDCDGLDECDLDADGYTADECAGDDCDDSDADVNPGATELWYDGVDGDCDEGSDYDADGDSFDSATYGGEDCDDADSDTYPGAPDEPYDGVINDCEGADEYDQDGDGYDHADYGGEDCDDANSDVNPGSGETWYDGVDQDCDGNDDDQDLDGYSLDDDCDDTDAESFPENGELDEECLEVDMDTGGSLGGATGGGGFKGCSDTKAAGMLGFIGLLALGLSRRRRDD